MAAEPIRVADLVPPCPKRRYLSTSENVSPAMELVDAVIKIFDSEVTLLSCCASSAPFVCMLCVAKLEYNRWYGKSR